MSSSLLQMKDDFQRLEDDMTNLGSRMEVSQLSSMPSLFISACSGWKYFMHVPIVLAHGDK